MIIGAPKLTKTVNLIRDPYNRPFAIIINRLLCWAFLTDTLASDVMPICEEMRGFV